jgi:hypothetical protein
MLLHTPTFDTSSLQFHYPSPFSPGFSFLFSTTSSALLIFRFFPPAFCLPHLSFTFYTRLLVLHFSLFSSMPCLSVFLFSKLPTGMLLELFFVNDTVLLPREWFQEIKRMMMVHSMHGLFLTCTQESNLYLHKIQ